MTALFATAITCLVFSAVIMVMLVGMWRRK